MSADTLPGLLDSGPTSWVLPNAAMPAKTAAMTAFESNIKRPRALLEMFDRGSLQPKPGERRSGGSSKQERELLRAAVVIAFGSEVPARDRQSAASRFLRIVATNAN